MAPSPRVLAAFLTAALVAAPAAAQVKAVPEVAAPVGGGVAGAQSGGSLAPAASLSAPTLASPSLALPGAPALVAPSIAPPPASAQASPSAARAALALPSAAAPRAAPKAQAAAASKPAPAAPAKNLEGLRDKTAEMGELLDKEGGGAQAGSQAAGIASLIFDGSFRGAAGGVADVSVGGPAVSARHRLAAPSVGARRTKALAAIGAGGMPVFDSVSFEVLSTVPPEARIIAVLEDLQGERRPETMTADDVLAAALEPGIVSIRVKGVHDDGPPASMKGLSKFKDAWVEKLPPDSSPDVHEVVVTFASGEAVRGAGTRKMLLELAARDDVVSLDYGEGAFSMRRVSEVPQEERGAGYDRAGALAAALGPGTLTSSQEAGIAGMRVHHGTLSNFEASVRTGPKNFGKGFGGRGLYVAVDGDRSIAEFFASKAALESRSHLAHNPEVSAAAMRAKPLVMDGAVTADRPLRVGRFQIKRNAVAADLQRGVLPADWDRDPNIAAMMERHFDVLDLRGMKSGGLAIDTDRFLVFHERAGADAIRWEGGAQQAAGEPGPSAAARAYGRFNLRLGRAFYRATGGSFGILPESFGTNSGGDPLIILERKTPPFSQALPAALRPAHYLSIGVNDAPDLASKKALIRAFAELTAPETLARLGIGEPGGALGFKVVTENPALVAFARRFAKDGWKVLPYAQGAGALDKAQHWLQHPYASLRRLFERAFGVSRPDPRFIILRDISAAPSRAPPETLRQVFNPLAAGEVIVDANIAIALEHQAHGDLHRPEHLAFVRRVGNRTARQPERAFAETRWGEPNAVVPIRTERTSPEYRALLAALDKALVGRAKGASDREIVADAFFAYTADGAPAEFYTGDKGIYNALARIAGHDPAKLGKSVPDAFPEGFAVSIGGRTLLVVPVASR